MKFFRHTKIRAAKLNARLQKSYQISIDQRMEIGRHRAARHSLTVAALCRRSFDEFLAAREALWNSRGITHVEYFMPDAVTA